jgi:predicted DNA-binding transcriptional regulator AlpA
MTAAQSRFLKEVSATRARFPMRAENDNRNGTAAGEAPNFPTPGIRTADRPPALAVEPLMVDAGQAAALCGFHRATWYRLQSAGKTPAPVKLGARRLFRVEDLRLWVSLGCPPREEFEEHKAAPARR